VPSFQCPQIPKTSQECGDSKSETRKLLESGGTDGSFKRPEEQVVTLIAPLSHPRHLPCKPLPES